MQTTYRVFAQTQGREYHVDVQVRWSDDVEHVEDAENRAVKRGLQLIFKRVQEDTGGSPAIQHLRT
jgi:hypothetical protein